ncbi:MAG: hypothetical protein HRU77_00110 [Gammaproteobacteria bacterium]|nr:MAG: hypothetical protein HRU77_00110 [Gammaproteobacteria bacterium]
MHNQPCLWLAPPDSQDDGLKKLTKELDEIKLAIDRLYEAVEKGFLPLDSSLQERSHKLNARKAGIIDSGCGIPTPAANAGNQKKSA